jgi:hypothetical protein
MYKIYNKNFYDVLGYIKKGDDVDKILKLPPSRMIMTSPDYHRDFFDYNNVEIFMRNCARFLESNGILALVLDLGHNNDQHNRMLNLLAYCNNDLSFWTFGVLLCGTFRCDILFFNKKPHKENNYRATNLIYSGDDFVDLEESDMLPFKQPFLDKILGDFTKENQIICDPFMGTGSVLEWCETNNRRFVGWERDKKRYDNVVKKLL